MLRSVLGTGLLVTVYRAALSVAAPGGNRGNVPPPEHKFFRAERIRIDKIISIKKFQNFVKFFHIFIEIFLKSFKINYQ